MRTEAMRSKMLYDRPLPVQRIVNAIADSELEWWPSKSNISSLSICVEAQVNTQQYGRRPYGVGLLVIGYDVSSKRKRDKEKKAINKDIVRKLDLIFLNALLLVQALNTTQCPLELDLNQLKHILKSIMKNFQMVSWIWQICRNNNSYHNSFFGRACPSWTSSPSRYIATR